MRDVLRLRNAIHRAIFLAPLALPAIACAKDDPAKTAIVNVPASGTGSVAAQATAPLASASSAPSATGDTSTAAPDDAGGPPRFRRPGMLPTCPSGAFCSTKAKMGTLADKASPKVLECPTTLEDRDRPDAPDGVPRYRNAHMSFDEAATKAARADAGASDACCYTWFIPCPGGRPLFEGETPVVADARAGTAWSERDVAVEPALSAEDRAAAAEAWLRDALAEHAAIASFARTTLELLSVGAPPDLVMDTQRAGMDEVRHAERCFELVRAYGTSPRAPGPLPLLAPRPADTARLARDTFIEGCVGETVSALAATRAAANATGEARATWRMLATDEARHAALAWRTLAWAMQASDASLGPELLAFAERMKDELLRGARAQAEGRGADAAVHGRLSPRELSRVHEDAWTELVLPTLRAMVHGDALPS